MGDKRSKVRTTTKLNNSRNIKSAPAIRRSKSHLVIPTKRKERTMNSSRPVPSTIPVKIDVLACSCLSRIPYLFLILFRQSFILP
jgi:hypothetical protein